MEGANAVNQIQNYDIWKTTEPEPKICWEDMIGCEACEESFAKDDVIRLDGCWFCKECHDEELRGDVA